MRILWLLPVALAALPLPARATAYYECPAYSPPAINVVPVYDEPSFDTSMGIRSIYEMAQGANYKSSSSREFPVGLTASTQQLNTSFEVSTQTMPNGIVCAQITSLEVTYGFTDTVVYIAHEFERGSCGYQEVLEHELRHVSVDQAIMDEYLPQLQTMVEGIVDNLGPTKVRSVEEANNYYETSLNRQMNQLNASLAATHGQKQAQVDTPEEYRRISKVCDGEIAHLVGEVMGR